MSLPPLLILAVVVGSVAASASPLLVTTSPVPGAGLPVALEVAQAGSWTERFAAFAAVAPGLTPVAFAESRPIPVLVESLYKHIGLPFTVADRVALEVQVAALPPSAEAGVRLVLGAVERGAADWVHATAAWTGEDWALLQEAAWGEPGSGLEVVAAKADLVAIRQSAMRVLAALDAAAPLLRQAAVEAGPNSGVLLRDPFDLVLVGGMEESVYRGNTAPAFAVDPAGHVLIIDLGGNDVYYNHPAAAHPQPAFVCDFGCGRGIPVSVLVDVQGDDQYQPQTAAGSGGAMGYGEMGGVGILLDIAGDDTYVANVGGSLGAAGLGVGLLLEAAGGETYLGPPNVGGYAVNNGVAALLDLSGADAYLAGSGSHGVAAGPSVGALFDLGGDDSFISGSDSQGYAFRGRAFFLNLGGSDTYDARADSRGWAESCGYLTGATWCSFAVFLDVCGVDTYTGLAQGSDGGSWQQNDFGYGQDRNEPAALCMAS